MATRGLQPMSSNPGPTGRALCARPACPVDFAPLNNVDLERFSWVREIAGVVAARFIRALLASPVQRTRPRRRSAPPPRSSFSFYIGPAWGAASAPVLAAMERLLRLYVESHPAL